MKIQILLHLRAFSFVSALHKASSALLCSGAGCKIILKCEPAVDKFDVQEVAELVPQPESSLNPQPTNEP